MSSSRVSFDPYSLKPNANAAVASAADPLQQLQQHASSHAAEEDTAFIAESTALLRGSRPELQNPLFVPIRSIVDMMKAKEEDKQRQISEHEARLREVSSTLKSYVHRHYDSFNDSIAYFSELIRKISLAQTCVATSHVDLSNVQGLFQCRALELESHFRRAAMSVLVKRILRNVAEAARGERQVDGLIQRRKFVDAARTFSRCRDIISQPQIQRISSGISSLTFFAQRSSETIRMRTFDFLLDVVFLKHEAQDAQLMALALARSSTLAFAGFASKNASAALKAARAASSAASLASGGDGDSSGARQKVGSKSSTTADGDDYFFYSYYLSSCTRDSPLFTAVRQAIGAFKQLGVLQTLPRMFCAAASACIESYFNAFITAYEAFVKDDFSAAEKHQGGGGGATGSGGDSSSTGNFASLISTSSSSSSAKSGSGKSFTSAALIQMVEERRNLAFIQRSAVTAFFKSVLSQAATILCNLQRVIEIVLEAELPLFPNSVVAGEVWKVAVASAAPLSSGSLKSHNNNSWNVEECRMPPWLTQKFVIPQVIRLVRDDASHINGQVLSAVRRLFGSSDASPDAPLPMWLMILTSSRHENFGLFLTRLLGTVREQLTRMKAKDDNDDYDNRNNHDYGDQDSSSAEENEEDEDYDEHHPPRKQHRRRESGDPTSLSAGTIGAIIGLIREHTKQAARQAIIDELQKFTAAWDMQLVWQNMQQLFVTMTRVLSGVAAAGEISELATYDASSAGSILFGGGVSFASSNSNSNSEGDNPTETNPTATSFFGEDGRLGLEKLAGLLSKKHRTSYLPQYLHDVGFLNVRVSSVADQLVANPVNYADKKTSMKDTSGDTNSGGSSSSRSNSSSKKAAVPGSNNDNNYDGVDEEGSDQKIPNFAQAAAMIQNRRSNSSSLQQVRVPFPRVVATLETALCNVIVPVAGNSLTIWICLEPFVALAKTLHCFSRADIGGIFKELGVVVSKQLLNQAHDYWLNQLSILDILSGYSGGASGSSLFLPEDKVTVHRSSLSLSLSSSHFHHHIPPLASTKDGASTNAVAGLSASSSAAARKSSSTTTISSRKPILEVVRCASRAVLTDYSPLLLRALGGGGSFSSSASSASTSSSAQAAAGKKSSSTTPSAATASSPSPTDLCENVVEKCVVFVDTLLSCCYQYLSQLSSIAPPISPSSAASNTTQQPAPNRMTAAKRALEILTATLNQGTEDEVYRIAKQVASSSSSSIYSYLDLQRTVDVPLTVLAGATELWEAVLDDLRKYSLNSDSGNGSNGASSNNTSTDNLLHKDKLLPMMSVASISSLSYSLKWFASEVLETQILSPLLLLRGSSSAASSQSIVNSVQRMIFKCRALAKCATLMLGVNLLALVLCKVNDLRNDAAYKVETCNQRPSVFASELVSELQANFSVVFSHLDAKGTLWLVSLLPQPTAKLLLSESVNIRDKRFSAAGVDQLVYDALALESAIKSLLMVSSSSSSSSDGNSGQGGSDTSSSSSSMSSSPDGQSFLISSEETPAYLEMISKPFSKPLEFFRLLRRGNDLERAKCIDDILSRNLYPRFSLDELETLLELVFREYGTGGKQANAPAHGVEDEFLTQQKTKLRNYVESTYNNNVNNNKNTLNNVVSGSGTSSEATSFKGLLAKASALFGDVSGSGLLMVQQQQQQQQQQPKHAAATITSTKQQKQSTKANDADVDHDEEDEEEAEEEEEDEEEATKDANKTRIKNPLLPPPPSRINNSNIPSTPASTILGGIRANRVNDNNNNNSNNTPASSVMTGAPSPLPRVPPQAAILKKNDAVDDGADSLGGEESQEFDEEEDEEEVEEDEEEDAPPPPPPPPLPPTSKVAAVVASTSKSLLPPPAISLRDRLKQLAKK